MEPVTAVTQIPSVAVTTWRVPCCRKRRRRRRRRRRRMRRRRERRRRRRRRRGCIRNCEGVAQIPLVAVTTWSWLECLFLGWTGCRRRRRRRSRKRRMGKEETRRKK